MGHRIAVSQKTDIVGRVCHFADDGYVLYGLHENAQGSFRSSGDISESGPYSKHDVFVVVARCDNRCDEYANTLYLVVSAHTFGLLERHLIVPL